MQMKPGRKRAIVAALLTTSGSAQAAPNARDTEPDTWEAADGLARQLPTHAKVGDPTGRLVFVFYYIWHQRSADPSPYDISQIIAGKRQPWSDAAWGPSPAFHWWAQPALGYYDINDEFVMRRHAQLLADAGVDAIVIDVTNAFTYDATWQKLCTTYQALRAAGNRTPNIAFITHASSDLTVEHLSDQLYAANACAGLWQQWLGKPLILAAADGGLSEAASNFFTFRESWAWTDPNGWFATGKDKWPWLDNHPQNFGWHSDPNTAEEMPVGIAQHPISNYGRSYHAGSEPPLDDNYLTAETATGLGFQEQWDTAIARKPQIAFVTQWNEWLAQRFVTCGTYDTGAQQFLGKPLACGDTHFIDEFNAEFSRDAEPMRGGFGDAYYYQLVSNIREFKGARAALQASAPQKIISGRFSDFDAVGPDYLDDIGDVTHRDWQAYAGPLRYVNSSGRNDIALARVARDSDELTFYVQTSAPLTPASDPGWMTLWLDTDSDASTGFLGFDYVVNRSRSASTATVERCSNGTPPCAPAGTATLAVGTNELMLGVGRSVIGLPPTTGRLSFRFKWTDNLPEAPQAADFLDRGDSAPNGRFMYRYVADEDEPAPLATGGAGAGAGAGNEAGIGGGPVEGAAGTPSDNRTIAGNSGMASGAAPAKATPGDVHRGAGCSCTLSPARQDLPASSVLLIISGVAFGRASRRRARLKRVRREVSPGRLAQCPNSVLPIKAPAA